MLGCLYVVHILLVLAQTTKQSDWSVIMKNAQNPGDQRNKPMRGSNLSIITPALLGCAFIITSLAGAPRHAMAALVFDVTQNTWGTTTDVGSFAWAIDQANTTPGVDTISIASGLEIDVDAGPPLTAPNTAWLARFTESAEVQGNGAKLVGNPAYVTSGETAATKTNIVGSPYSPSTRAHRRCRGPQFQFRANRDLRCRQLVHQRQFHRPERGRPGNPSPRRTKAAQVTLTGGDFDKQWSTIRVETPPADPCSRPGRALR